MHSPKIIMMSAIIVPILIAHRMSVHKSFRPQTIIPLKMLNIP